MSYITQNLPINDLRAPLAVVCHDAGATNLLAAWLQHYPAEFNIYAEGPAAKILSLLFPCQRFADSLNKCLDGAQCLLSGTGWASDLEHSARKIAQDSGLYSIAVVDHWVNYPQRFIRNQIEILPNEIWLSDEYALAIAKQEFKDIKLKCLPNLYLDSQVKNIKIIEEEINNKKAQLLYILEPIRSDWGHEKKPGEFQALELFLENIECIGLSNKIDIVLRPHPSECNNKYDYILKKYSNLNIIINNKDALALQIASSKWVAGCQSFALVIALAADKEVISTLPPWAPVCSLPMNKIKHFRDYIK